AHSSHPLRVLRHMYACMTRWTWGTVTDAFGHMPRSGFVMSLAGLAPENPTPSGGNHMRMHIISLYVDDQDKALKFYTEVLGFQKKMDVGAGQYRWLTVASPEEPEGPELQLAPNDNPAAKAYQQAMFQQDQPAIMFYTNDVKGDYERITARGAEFTMPPTDV